MLYKTILIVIITLCSNQMGYSQSQITEINGRKAEILKDGTWKYLEEDEEQIEDNNDEETLVEEVDSLEVNNTLIKAADNSTCQGIISTDYDIKNYSLKFRTEPSISDHFSMYWKLDKASGRTLILKRMQYDCLEEGIPFTFYFGENKVILKNMISDNCIGFAGFNVSDKDLEIFKRIPLTKVAWGKRESKIWAEKGDEFLFRCDCFSKVGLKIESDIKPRKAPVKIE